MTNKQAYIIQARNAGCDEGFIQAMANVSIYDPELSAKMAVIRSQYPTSAAIAKRGYPEL